MASSSEGSSGGDPAQNRSTSTFYSVQSGLTRTSGSVGSNTQVQETEFNSVLDEIGMMQEARQVLIDTLEIRTIAQLVPFVPDTWETLRRGWTQHDGFRLADVQDLVLFDAWYEEWQNDPKRADALIEDFVRPGSPGEAWNTFKIKTWESYIMDHSDIGLITLCYMHWFIQGWWFSKLCVMALLGGVVFAQLTIPIIVFISTLEEYNGGFCPASADEKTKVLAFAIGGIYVTKLAFLFAEKLFRAGPGFFPVLDISDHGGVLTMLVMFDRFMDIIYEGLVYLLNLWIVFVTEEPLDMVLNALAMEFVLQLDNEVKKSYVTLFPPDRMMVNAYQEKNRGGRNIYYRVSQWTARFTLILAFPLFLAVFAGFIILPICKPGESHSESEPSTI